MAVVPAVLAGRERGPVTGMRYLNASGHRVTVYPDGTPDLIEDRDAVTPLMDLPRGDMVARVREDVGTPDGSGGIPTAPLAFGEIDGLPEPEPGVSVIVSRLTAISARAAGQNRTDLVFPADKVRAIVEGEQRIVGCRSLAWLAGAPTAPGPGWPARLYDLAVWIDALPVRERLRVVELLGDQVVTRGHLAAVRYAAIHELAAQPGVTREQLAVQLGVTVPVIDRAIFLHRKAVKAGGCSGCGRPGWVDDFCPACASSIVLAPADGDGGGCGGQYD